MAIINTYPKATPKVADLLIGTQVKDDNITENSTKSFSVSSIGSLLITSNDITTGSGTTNTLPIWTDGPNGVLGDSIITYDDTSIPTITIGPQPSRLVVDGDLIVNNRAVFEGPYARFNGPIEDGAGSSGTTGQLLTSTGTGVAWKSPTNIPNNVSGQGSNLTIPMWYGSTPTSNLADSTIALRLVSPGAANPYSLQFGGNSQAYGTRNAVALGYANTAAAEATLATGHGTTASGLHAASFNFGTTASGEKSAAFGINTVASGTNSFAIGNATTAATSLAFAGGLNSTANPSLNGSTAFAYGNAVNAFGPNSAAFGKQNSAQGENSFVAGGAGCIASGKNSQVIGNLSSAVQEKAIAIGDKNKAWAFGSIVIGMDSIAVSGKNSSIVLGMGLSASTDKQVVLGRNNKLTGASKFVVGNGPDANNRKNGLEITGSYVAIPDYGSGAIAGNAKYNLSVDEFGKIVETAIPAAPNYLRTVLLVSQSGPNPPANDIVLENGLGIPGPFNWTRIAGGEYNLNAPGKFKLLKTIVFLNGGSAENNHDIAWEVLDSDNLRIRTHNSDGKLTKASLEIRTYN